MVVHHVEINGLVITVEEAGAGPAVVLLHAGIADARQWDPQFGWLSESFRVVRWDQRGFGQTPLTPGSFSYTEDVLAVMDALGIDRATLVGCSMGGATAIRFACQHPKRVERLVLVGSGLHGFSTAASPPAIYQEMEDAWNRKDYDRVLDLDEKAWIIGLNRDASQVDPAFRALARDMNRSSLKNAAVDASPIDHTTSDVAAIRELTMPVLVVTGDEDLPDIQETARYVASQARNVTVRVIHDATHLPNLERPDIFDKILRAWLHKTSTPVF